MKYACKPCNTCEDQPRTLFVQDPTNRRMQDNVTNLIDLYNPKNSEVHYRDAYYIANSLAQPIVCPLQNYKGIGDLVIVPSWHKFVDNFNIVRNHVFTN